MTASDAHLAIQTVFRAEFARLIAGLTAIVRDVGVAEELAQDALIAALENWPAGGVPDNPGAWLMTVARRRALNVHKRSKMLERKHDALAHEQTEEDDEADVEVRLDAAREDVGDDVLRLLFIACHPVLSKEGRVALTLRLLGGLTTEEIARAFLVPEPTIAQRIVRAKRTLAEKQVPFEMPQRVELDQRLASVLEVVYLIFNEGYSATAGDDLLRPGLTEDALRLGRVLTELAPEEPEAHGLLGLMELNASRFAARIGPTGEPILLPDQDRSRWDRDAIGRGLTALSRAESLRERRGPYTLQAAIAACHARAITAADTDWTRIAAFYDEMLALVPSPVVALNHAVAVSRAHGPEAGLVLLDALAQTPTLKNYHLLPSARADLLVQLGRLEEAATEFERAAALTQNTRQRERLLSRAAGCRQMPA